MKKAKKKIAKKKVARRNHKWNMLAHSSKCERCGVKVIWSREGSIWQERGGPRVVLERNAKTPPCKGTR